MTAFEVNGFTRVSKAAAKKRYDAGLPVYLCPVKMRPGGPWNPETQILKPRAQADFLELVNAATFYLCSPAAGRYLAFYYRPEEARRRASGGEEVVPF